jgi:hypothetical protein
MIYAIARLNILGMLSIYIEKTERSDTTNLQSSIVNIQFRLVRVGYLVLGINPTVGQKRASLIEIATWALLTL